MPETVTFTERLLTLRTPHPGITMEYDSSSDPRAIYGDLRDALGQALIATDASLRQQNAANPIYDRIEGIQQRLVDEGLVDEVVPRQVERHATLGAIGLYALADQMAMGLVRPQSETYSIGGCGTPRGGYNAIGDRAVSKAFDYDSPLQLGTVDEAHWYKQALQVILHGENSFTIGTHSFSQQRLSAKRLGAEIASSEFAQFIEKQPTIRISETQPRAIAELSFGSDVYGETGPTAFHLPGFTDAITKVAKDHHFDYTPFTSRDPVRYGATAAAVLIDNKHRIGVRLTLSAYPDNRNEKEQLLTFDCNPETELYTVKDIEHDEPAVSSFSLRTDIMSAMGSQGWGEFRQAENVWPPYLQEQVIAIDGMMRQIRNNLLNT